MSLNCLEHLKGPRTLKRCPQKWERKQEKKVVYCTWTAYFLEGFAGKELREHFQGVSNF